MLTKNHSKQFFLILFFALSFLFCTQVLAAEPVDSLDIGIWHFDDTDQANAKDFSIYSYDLVWNSNPWGGGKINPERVRGKFDMGINFTQSSERYGLQDFGSVDLSTGVTIGAWVKTDNTASWKARVLWLGNYIDSRIQDPSNFIGLSVQNGQVHLDLKQNKILEREIVSSKIINDNDWHFLTAVFDADKRQMSLYVDGQFQSQSSFELPIPLFEMLSIGMTENRFDYEQIDFLGVVDDVWLRQEPLNEEKINNIFQSGQAYKFDTQNYDLAPPSVFVNYDFDHINGTVALDSSANHYDIFWGYNMYSPTASPTPRLVPGKFNQGANFKKDWETYSRKFDPIKNFSQGFSSGIWIKTSEVNELPARIFWTGTEPKGHMDEVAYSDYLAVTEVDGKIKVDLNFYDGYFEGGQIMFKRQYSLNSKTFISDDTWHHIAVTLDSRPNVRTMKLYIDGNLEDTSFFPGLIPPVDKLALGHREYPACATEYNFNGTEDDFFIMNSVISDKDVKDIYESNSAFTWPIRKRNPVIIVPGIMGSYLNRVSDREEVWPNLFKMVAPGKDRYLDELSLPYSGDFIGETVYAKDIVRNIRFINIEKDFFQGLITELNNKGYVENRDLFVFPYDWRLDITEVAGDNTMATGTLSWLIEKVREDTKSSKVDIIAHSMGGLVAKKYIHNSNNNAIDKFVDIATPHYGAPEAFKILQYGDDMGMSKNGFGLNGERVKNISQNFPSVYQLLPSRKYFESGNFYYNYYIYDTQSSPSAKTYDQSIDFLKLSGRNWGLLDKAQAIHDEIDNMSISNVYNIVGCGVPTLGLFRIQDMTGNYEKDIDPKYLFGDGTVPIRSALGINTDNVYYENKTEHSYLPSINGVRQLVGSILGNEVESFDFNQYSTLSQNPDNCIYSGVQLGIHSPVELNIYDENNNHVGPDENGDIEINIPGVQYDIFDDKKFAFLPAGHQYKILGKATDLGSFSVRVERIENGDYKDQVYFSDVPIDNVNMVIKYDIEDTQNIGGIKIEKDNNGDGIFEEQVEPSSILSEVEAADTEAPVTEISFNGELSETGVEYYSPVELEFDAIDALSGVLKTEYSINSTSTWEVYASTSKPIIQEPGNYTIYYFSVDRAGIREGLKTKTITVIEKDCLELLVKTVNDLYVSGDIKKVSVKNFLLLKLEIIEKMLNKFEVRDSKICHKLKFCEKFKVKMSKASKLMIDINLKIIKEQLKLYERQKWITKEARDIMLNKIQCIYNY